MHNSNVVKKSLYNQRVPTKKQILDAG